MDKTINRPYRALLAIMAALYLLAVIAIAVVSVFHGRLKVPAPGPILALTPIILGLIIVAGLYRKHEWARKAVLLLAMYSIYAAGRVMIICMTTPFSFAKLGFIPVDMIATAAVWIVHLLLGIWVLYLAMAYPVAAEAPAEELSAPSAR